MGNTSSSLARDAATVGFSIQGLLRRGRWAGMNARRERTDWLTSAVGFLSSIKQQITSRAQLPEELQAGTGTYGKDHDPIPDLVNQIKGAQRTITFACESCHLEVGSDVWHALVDGLRASPQRIDVVVYVQKDPGEALRRLAKKDREEPLITLIEVGAPEGLPFFGRIIDSVFVEVNDHRGICGNGAYTRIRNSTVAASIELQLAKLAESTILRSHEQIQAAG